MACLSPKRKSSNLKEQSPFEKD